MQLFARQIEQLTLRNAKYRQFALSTLIQAYAADVGTYDVTTALLGLRQKQLVTAEIRAKEAGIVAGLSECELFWRKYGITVELLKKDGATVRCGEVLVRLRGSAAAILTTERTALNLLQRMSGIATATNRLVQLVGQNRVAGTRKTPFGLLDCRAIVVGGGLPHRLNLADQILVKENHLAVDPECWKRIRTKDFFEIEADNEKLAIEIAEYYKERGGKLILLLDNFTPPKLKKLVPQLRRIHPSIILEASGGITPKNIQAYLAVGVDYVSLGYLTHSSRALDLSLRVYQ
jgi:nicotinate-nucleotide pyrophosphorylase (carboxylating)